MVSPLFTAFALIACGRVELPPAPAQPTRPPEVRGHVREDRAADRNRHRG